MDTKAYSAPQPQKAILTDEASLRAFAEVVLDYLAQAQQKELNQLDPSHRKVIARKFSQFSTPALQLIQAVLREKGVVTEIDLNQVLSNQTFILAIEKAVFEKKPQQAVPSAPVETIACGYFEREHYDCFALTQEGDVVCLLPFIACDEYFVSSENTCRTGVTLKEWLAGSGDTRQGPKILAVLEAYLHDLRSDLFLLGLFTIHDQASDESARLLDQFSKTENATVKEKIKRYFQLRQYQSALESLLFDPEFKNMVGNSRPQLPPQFLAAFKDANIVSSLLAPQVKYQHTVLRLQAVNPLFSLQRKQIESASNNEAYSTGFADGLDVALQSLEGCDQLKLLSTTSSYKELLHCIEANYQNITTSEGKPQKATSPSPIIDMARLRRAVLEALETMFPSEVYEPYQKLVSANYIVRAGKKTKVIPDNELYSFIQEKIFLVEDNLTIEDCLMVILNDDQLKALTESENISPFNASIPLPTLAEKRWSYYHELIQIFLMVACRCYYEVSYCQSQGAIEMLNFGAYIEQFPDKQSDLILAIKAAIEKKTSLEDALLDAIETHILSDRTPSKFTEETRQKITQLFRALWRLYYASGELPPHIDENVMGLSNRPGCTKVVHTRSKLALPLDVLCKNSPNPALRKLFDTTAVIPLPCAEKLILEADGITVGSPVAKLSLNSTDYPTVEVMPLLLHFLSTCPSLTAKWLMKRTSEGEEIYGLLNAEQAQALKEHQNWPQVVHEILLSHPHSQQFKERFGIDTSLLITRDRAQALFSYYFSMSWRRSKSNFETLPHTKKIETVLTDILEYKEIKQDAPSLTKTESSLHVANFKTVQAWAVIKKICDQKESLYISQEMASYIYKAAGGKSDFYQAADSRLSTDSLGSNARFVLALKSFFSDQTVLADTEKAPEGVSSDHIIGVRLNPNDTKSGYTVSAANPDHLHRILDICEAQMTHTVSALQAGKIVTEWAKSLPGEKKPIVLNAEIFETALVDKNIICEAVVKEGLTYQIICTRANWEKITKAHSCRFDPALVDLCEPSISLESMIAFFNCIEQKAFVTAQSLLLAQPGLVNVMSPDYGCTPLRFALGHAHSASDWNDFKAYMEFCFVLLAQPHIELLHRDGVGDTIAHNIIFFSAQKNTDKERFNLYKELLFQVAWKRLKAGDFWDFFDSKNKLKQSIEDYYKLYDKSQELQYSILSKVFWSLIDETNGYDFEPAMVFFEKSWSRCNKFATNLKNSQHPKTQESLLSTAIKTGTLIAASWLLTPSRYCGIADSNRHFTVTGDLWTQYPLELALALYNKGKIYDQAKIIDELLSAGAKLHTAKIVRNHCQPYQENRHQIQQEIERLKQTRHPPMSASTACLSPIKTCERLMSPKTENNHDETETKLREAIRGGDPATVKELLNNGLNANKLRFKMENDDPCTQFPLDWAVTLASKNPTHKRRSVVRVLLYINEVQYDDAILCRQATLHGPEILAEALEQEQVALRAAETELAALKEAIAKQALDHKVETFAEPEPEPEPVPDPVPVANKIPTVFQKEELSSLDHSPLPDALRIFSKLSGLSNKKPASEPTSSGKGPSQLPEPLSRFRREFSAMPDHDQEILHEPSAEEPQPQKEEPLLPDEQKDLEPSPSEPESEFEPETPATETQTVPQTSTHQPSVVEQASPKQNLTPPMTDNKPTQRHWLGHPLLWGLLTISFFITGFIASPFNVPVLVAIAMVASSILAMPYAISWFVNLKDKRDARSSGQMSSKSTASTYLWGLLTLGLGFVFILAVMSTIFPNALTFMQPILDFISHFVKTGFLQMGINLSSEAAIILSEVVVAVIPIFLASLTVERYLAAKTDSVCVDDKPNKTPDGKGVERNSLLTSKVRDIPLEPLFSGQTSKLTDLSIQRNDPSQPQGSAQLKVQKQTG